MRALITGITGQDGSYLAEMLLSKGYEVHGLKRRSSSFNTGRIDSIFGRLHLHHGDMTDSTSLARIIETVRPNEIYNLAAQSHVAVSFEAPEYTSDTDALGALRLFEAARLAGLDQSTRIYQASTSELFGRATAPQSETTPMRPISPYGCAKLYAFELARTYRDAYGMFVANGILFNHESPRRGETFVSRKITRAVGAIRRGEQEVLYLGNLDAVRDWGHARDYVEAMWRMLQCRMPHDLVIGTGESHTVREFVSLAFEVSGMPLRWEGMDYDEVGIDDSGVVRVVVDESYFRPLDVPELRADTSVAREVLGWSPTVSFGALVREMVVADA